MTFVIAAAGLVVGWLVAELGRWAWHRTRPDDRPRPPSHPWTYRNLAEMREAGEC
jgi:hypothetical protein